MLNWKINVNLAGRVFTNAPIITDGIWRCNVIITNAFANIDAVDMINENIKA